MTINDIIIIAMDQFAESYRDKRWQKIRRYLMSSDEMLEYLTQEIP